MDFYIYSINLNFPGVELANLQEGEYRVYFASKSSESQKWEPVRSYDERVNSAIITISDGKILLEDEYNSGWTTGIENISNAKYGSNDTMFSITGQLVDSSYRGIIIRNGRKYIVK